MSFQSHGFQMLGDGFGIETLLLGEALRMVDGADVNLISLRQRAHERILHRAPS